VSQESGRAFGRKACGAGLVLSFLLLAAPPGGLTRQKPGHQELSAAGRSEKAMLGGAGMSRAAGQGSGDSPEVPDPRTALPPPQVEMDVVNILADFPREERPYVQKIVHTVKDLQQLNKQCTKKAAVFAQKGLPRSSGRDQVDLANLSELNQGYLRYFDPLRAYLRVAYKQLYALKPPPRFEKAHKYWLAYLAYALENLDQQRSGDRSPASRPSHSPVEVTQYRAWSCRLFKENGLDLAPYIVN